jgi:hypothetical protein
LLIAALKKIGELFGGMKANDAILCRLSPTGISGKRRFLFVGRIRELISTL